MLKIKAYFKSLKGKILLSFLVVDISILVALTVTVSVSVQKTLGSLIEDQLKSSLSGLTFEINEDLNRKWVSLNNLAHQDFGMQAQGKSGLLENFTLPGHGKAEIFILNDGKNISAKNNQASMEGYKLLTSESSRWLPNILNGKDYAGVLSGKNRHYIIMAFPDTSGGAAVALFDLSGLIQEMSDEFENLFTKNVDLTILEDKNLLWGSNISGDILDRISGNISSPEILKQDKKVYAILPLEPKGIENFRWQIVLSFQSEKIYAPINTLRTNMLLVGVLLALIFGYIVIWKSNNLIKPVGLLEDAMNGIMKKGEMHRRVFVSADDEVGALGKTFNKMLDTLMNTTVSKEYLDDILNHMLNSLVVLNRNHTIRTVNPATLKMLEYEDNELLDKDGTMIFSDSEFGKSILSRVVNEEMVNGIETTYKTKKGKDIQVSFSGSVMRTKNDMIQGIILVAQDITELKSAERKLRRLNETLEERVTERTRELRQSNEELTQFAYIASHDLQEPLRKITTFGERLKDKCGEALGEKGADYLDRMQNAANRMQTLINGLLDYSRISTKGQPFVAVDLSVIMKDILSDLEIRIEQTHAQIDYGTLPVIEGDPLQMRQLFQNLIGNALKFHSSDKKPVIKITHSYGESITPSDDNNMDSGKVCQISVKDNGIGFEEEYSERIFGVFQRLHGRSEYEGTGIGLSICRKIVERHNGFIIAKSNQDDGAEFIFTFPATGNKGE